MTGDDNPVSGEVIWVNSGATAADFPAATTGKIVLMQPGAPRPRRATRRSSTLWPRAPSA